jgi:XTP/dITP diphosphohydrolase
MKDIIFATGNEGKLREVKKIFTGTGFNIISINDLENVPEIIEDGETFEANGFIKADTLFSLFKIPAMADDSGLSVDQLNGRPGVHSARYAGENCTYEDNNKKLIGELAEFDPPHPAQFICCAVYVDDKNRIPVEGVLRGQIINEFRGQNGFGYDPIFIPENYENTLAEISLEEKNSISHRGKAFRKLREQILSLK